MVKRSLIIVTIITLVLAISLGCIYFLAFRTLTIVSDGAFSQVLPKSELRTLRFSLATKGIRLKIEAFEDNSFYDESTFSSRLEKVGGDWVLLSPVSCAFCVSHYINASEILSKSVVIGLYSNPYTGLFDCTLVSDPASGWALAAKAVFEESQKTSRNAALIYEKNKSDYIDDIRSAFPNGWLSIFEDDGQSNLFVSEVKLELDRHAILVAMCPYEKRLADFFSEPGTVKWVVDYRFAPAVPKSQLHGIVVPDFAQALKSAFLFSKGSYAEIMLEYKYEKL